MTKTAPSRHEPGTRGRYGRGMEEARRLLARLERIETLDRRRARPAELLEELRALLVEAEAWARAERTVPDAAAEALDRCRALIQEPGRTLVA